MLCKANIVQAISETQLMLECSYKVDCYQYWRVRSIGESGVLERQEHWRVRSIEESEMKLVWD